MFRRVIFEHGPWFVVLIHTFVVLWMAFFVASGIGTFSEREMAWVLFMAVDFPLGWLAIPLELWLSDTARQHFGEFGSFVLLPTVSFGILGGIQYYWVAKLVVYSRRRVLAARRLQKGECVKCGHDLRGFPEPRCPECGTPFDPKILPSQDEPHGPSNLDDSNER